jgi:hypothetical protein
VKPGVLLILAPLLGACTTLAVKVDVLDPAYVATSTNESRLRTTASELAAGDHTEAERTFAQLVQDRRRLRASCLEEVAQFGEAMRPQFAANDLPRLEGNIRELRADITDPKLLAAFDAAINPVRQRLLAADAAVNAGASGAGATPLPADVVAALTQRRRIYDAEIEASLSLTSTCPALAVGGRVFSVSVAEVAPKTAALQQAMVQAVQKSVVGGGTLLSAQREAYYVVNADEHLWANRFNRAFGWGFGGGTDVVIKLNDTADFTVKGLVFDARSTADMVRKVGASAISLIASAYGAPVSIAAATADKPAGPKFGTDQVAASETAISVEQMRQQAYRDALLHLADNVLAEWDGLTSADTPTREAAATRVNAGFDAAKNAWQAGQSAGTPTGATPPK